MKGRYKTFNFGTTGVFFWIINFWHFLNHTRDMTQKNSVGLMDISPLYTIHIYAYSRKKIIIYIYEKKCDQKGYIIIICHEVLTYIHQLDNIFDLYLYGLNPLYLVTSKLYVISYVLPQIYENR